jgi:hypothetical protein
MIKNYLIHVNITTIFYYIYKVIKPVYICTFKGENQMAETLKFVYIVILFVSLFIVVVVGESKFILIIFFLCLGYTQSFTNFSNISLLLLYFTANCVSDIMCYRMNPKSPPGTMICWKGFCKCLRHPRLFPKGL